MPLEEYKKKRDFKKSPEPEGGKPTEKKLHFVIQKHQASHLHYDFRLELHGVLKSWAVPKGLSMDPSVRRLAMLVEDHPWDYRNFEGIIPSGYGAGTVMVWDEGTYETPEAKEDKKSQEHSINSQFWKGAIKFTLHGHKVKGDFAIYRDKSKGDNHWYIQKLKDEYATKKDITLKDRSVISGKDLEEIKENPGRKWTSKSERTNEEIEDLILQGNKEKMPKSIDPMMCVLIKEPFDDDEWIYELKLDGYRVIAIVDGDKVSLKSRSGLDYTKKFQAVADAFKGNDIHAVFDGEMTFTGEDGTPDFDKLQSYNGNGPLLYFVFDLLWINGYNICDLDLLSRKKILGKVLPPSDFIEYTQHFFKGKLFFEEIEERQLEGIVAKRKNSSYQPGKRSKDWLKLPTEKKQEFVIGGWAESSSGRAFKSLLFGAYSNGKFLYVGHSGAGFSEKERKSILTKLQKIETKKSPFTKDIDVKATVHYVKPKLVANFKFATWTAAGKIRKPAIFKGFREDKDPKDVVREIPLTANEEEKTVHTQKETEPAKEESESNWKYIFDEKITSEDSVKIDGHEVPLTNIEKQLWKNITKAALIEYYHRISPYILPYLKDRPQSLHIKNINARAPGFYIKDMEGHQPEWAEIFTVKRKHAKKGKSKMIHYLLCNNEATLLYMVNLGCIDINPWISRKTDYLHPDFLVIDLDPSDDDFSKAIEAAKATKEVLKELKLVAFPKTSGKTGIHIYIPCEGLTFTDTRKLAIFICKKINEKLPEITTVENSIAARGDKLFLDYNQNDEADTVAAPYSARPASSPTVSAPLEWKEIKKGLSPQNFTIENIFERIKKKGDLFEKAPDKKIKKANTKVLKKALKDV